MFRRSRADRALIDTLTRERDEARARVRQLQIERATGTLEWLCEPENYTLMWEMHPELMARLHRALDRRSYRIQSQT